MRRSRWTLRVASITFDNAMTAITHVRNQHAALTPGSGDDLGVGSPIPPVENAQAQLRRHAEHVAQQVAGILCTQRDSRSGGAGVFAGKNRERKAVQRLEPCTWGLGGALVRTHGRLAVRRQGDDEHCGSFRVRTQRPHRGLRRLTDR